MALVQAEGVRHRHSYSLDADHDLRDQAKGIADEVFDIMIDAMVNQPRSLQKRIGPSEMGIECSRRILYKLAQVPEPDRGPAWKPQVGTALHAQQEEWFGRSNKLPDTADRWLIEESVNVGQIGGQDHPGHTDLFDKFGHAVLDWKFVGASMLAKYKAHGPSAQYRTQAHLYGKGWADEGWQTDLVMIFFIPRDGELSDAHVWSEPFDRTVAENALARMNQLDGLLKALGLEQALSLYPNCGDRFCPWCSAEHKAAYQAAKNPFTL